MGAYENLLRGTRFRLAGAFLDLVYGVLAAVMQMGWGQTLYAY